MHKGHHQTFQRPSRAAGHLTCEPLSSDMATSGICSDCVFSPLALLLLTLLLLLLLLTVLLRVHCSLFHCSFLKKGDTSTKCTCTYPRQNKHPPSNHHSVLALCDNSQVQAAGCPQRSPVPHPAQWSARSCKQLQHIHNTVQAVYPTRSACTNGLKAGVPWEGLP